MILPSIIGGSPVKSLWGAALGLALLASGCAGTHVPRQLSHDVTPPPPGLAELHRRALENPTSPEPHVRLADLYLTQGNEVLAADEARTAVALGPADASAHAVLARVLLQLSSGDDTERHQRIEEASREIGRALELQPGAFEHELLAVSIDLELGDLDRADNRLTALSTRYPADSRVVFEQGRVQARRHRYGDAAALFERAAALGGEQRLVTFQAWASFLAGNDAEALALYDSVPERCLGRADRMVLVILALRREALDEAEAQLRARYLRPDETQDLLHALELMASVRNGHLKVAALADLMEASLAQEVPDLDRAEAVLRRALEVDRRVPDAPEALAELLLAVRRDPRQALKVLTDAPDRSASYRRFDLFIQTYRMLQDAVGAQEVLREFIEFVARDVELGHREDARDALESMVLALPVPSLWQFLVDLAVEDEDLSGLDASWERLKTAIPRLDVQFSTITAAGYIQLGRYQRADRMLRQALLREPTNQTILVNLGKLAEKRGDAFAAEEVYRRMTVIHPGEASAWVQLGRFYMGQLKFEDARGAFEEALRREEDPPEALTGLARALTQLELFDQAMSTARHLTEVKPEDGSSWLELAAVAGEAHRYLEQEQALRQALIRDQSAANWNSLAVFLLNVPDPRQRRVDEALAAASRANELSHDQVAAFLDTLADAQYESGKYADALKTIEAAITLQPEYDYYHRQRRKIRSAIETASPGRFGL